MNGELRRQAGEYLQMRHGIGYELQRPGRLVRQFAANCDAAGITHVTIQAALDWAVLPQEVSSWYQWLRLSAVRGLAAYLHALDPAHQIPPAALQAAAACPVSAGSGCRQRADGRGRHAAPAAARGNVSDADRVPGRPTGTSTRGGCRCRDDRQPGTRGAA